MASDIKLTIPVIGVVTQYYGENVEYYKKWGYCCGHNGIDYGCPERSPVHAAADGIYMGRYYENGGYGIYVILDHSGFKTLYAHLHSDNYWDVKAGDKVKAGQEIALSGNTGASTGAHLHFGLKIPGSKAKMKDYVDPLPYFFSPADGNTTENPTLLYSYKEQMELVCDVDVLNIRSGIGTHNPMIDRFVRGDEIWVDELYLYKRDLWVKGVLEGKDKDGCCAWVYNGEVYLKSKDSS